MLDFLTVLLKLYIGRILKNIICKGQGDRLIWSVFFHIESLLWHTGNKKINSKNKMNAFVLLRSMWKTLF